MVLCAESGGVGDQSQGWGVRGQQPPGLSSRSRAAVGCASPPPLGPVPAGVLHNGTAVALHDGEVVKMHDVEVCVATFAAGGTTPAAVADEGSGGVLMWEGKTPPATIAAQAAEEVMPQRATSESCDEWSGSCACRCSNCASYM
jgi:hypothetical protein